MRSVYDNLTLAGYAAAFNTTNAVVCVGAGVDTRGYNSAALRVFVGTVGAGIPVNTGSSLTAVLEESADNVTYSSALDNTGVQIGFPTASVITATTTAVLQSARIEGLLQNRLRYLRVRTTAAFGGAASVLRQFTSCAVLELGRAYQNPISSTVSNT